MMVARVQARPDHGTITTDLRAIRILPRLLRRRVRTGFFHLSEISTLALVGAQCSAPSLSIGIIIGACAAAAAVDLLPTANCTLDGMGHHPLHPSATAQSPQPLLNNNCTRIRLIHLSRKRRRIEGKVFANSPDSFHDNNRVLLLPPLLFALAPAHT